MKQIKKSRAALLLLLAVIGRAGDGEYSVGGGNGSPEPVHAHQNAKLYRQMRYLMGTLCEIRLYADSEQQAEEAFHAGFAEIKRLDLAWSSYRPESELSRVNRQARSETVALSRELNRILAEAEELNRESGGTFDVTVGPLVRLWGFFSAEQRIPSTVDQRATQSCVGWRKVELDSAQARLRFKVPCVEIDLGGIAKGYAAEQAARAVERQGISSAIVNIGGSSLYAIGKPQRERGWPVAVRDPRDPARELAILYLGDHCALGTSGTSEKFFLAGKRRFSHIFDPRAGMPLAILASATLVTDSGSRADALAKSLLMLRREEFQELLQAGRGDEWLVAISSNGRDLVVEQSFSKTPIRWMFQQDRARRANAGS